MMRLSKRFRRVSATILALAVLVVGGWAWARSRHAVPAAAWDALNDADCYELFSIEPDVVDGGLDRYPILGKTTVVDPATRSALNAELDRTARESQGWTALCFEPRHGARVTRAGVTTDFVVCFKCMQVQVWQGDKQIAHFSTNNSAEPLFDRVLSQAGVTLAAKHQ